MLNLLALEALRAFVEGGNVAQAAARVHRTQPQVSRLLTGLQDALGFAILRKEGRSLVLTPEGRALYRKVELLLDAADGVRDFARATRQQRIEHVKLVCTPHIAQGLLADALARAKAGNPRLSASVDTRAIRDLEPLLGQGQFDLALTQLPVEHPRVLVRELVRSQAVVVMQAGHPLARQRVVRAEQLRAHCMVLLPAHSLLRLRWEAVLGAGCQAPYFEVSSGPLAAQLAARGAGVALTDPFAALAQLHCGALIRRFEPAIALRYGMLLPKDRPPTPATRLLMDELTRVAHERLALLEHVFQRAAHGPPPDATRQPPRP